VKLPVKMSVVPEMEVSTDESLLETINLTPRYPRSPRPSDSEQAKSEPRSQSRPLPTKVDDIDFIGAVGPINPNSLQVKQEKRYLALEWVEEDQSRCLPWQVQKEGPRKN
jgi:hypothetical protein